MVTFCMIMISYGYPVLLQRNLNIIVHKGYNHFNLQLSEIHKNRLNIHKNILNVVKSGKLLDKQISDKLKRDDVYLITNIKNFKTFSNEENVQISQNYFIVFFY